MAKKKKSAGKRAKKSYWYPKTIGFLGLFGLILAAYCYFSPQSSSIPVVAGRDYPKRTRGIPIKQTTYAVYDRLAGQSKHDATRLLPPDEVPDWNPMDAEENPVAAPVTHQSSNASAHNQSANTAVASAGSAEKFTPHTDKKVSTKPVMPAKPTPVLKPVSKSKPPVASKKNGAKNDSTKSTKQTGISLRLQIGTIQSQVEKAEKIIQNIRKKGRIPPHMRPIIQKATIKGKTVYRVILVGHCSEKVLKEYQRYLG
jgi:hypothetical protein